MLHCVYRARVLALTGELHFPKIFSARPYEQATSKIAASRAVQRRGLPGVKAVALAQIVHQCSVSDLPNIVIMTR
jgi:hypothetical protein